MMDLHPDFKDLLAELVRCEVDFVIVGGHAVAAHGKPRATKEHPAKLIPASGQRS
jgi:hypothetical protein